MTGLILIAVALAAILAIDIVWSERLRQRLEAERRKNEELAQLLERTMFEAAAAQTRDRAYANHLMHLRNDAVSRANEIIRRERTANQQLNVLIQQKWQGGIEHASNR